MEKTSIRCADLFSGAGGSSYGARNAGVEIVAGFDYWKPANKVYKENFPGAKVYSQDIRKIDLNRLQNTIGRIDLLLASPECTSHSKAKGAKEGSEKSRETAFQVVRFAKAFMPDWIVIENVVDMVSWRRYKELARKLGDLGYQIRDNVILNAKDFGVPQSRERLFILCSLHGEPNAPALNQTPTVPVSKIIEKNTYEFTPLRKDGRANATISRADSAIEVLGTNQPFLLVYYGSAKTGPGGWQKISEPLRTITTVDRFAYVMPNGDGHKMRMLQPEELKRAMGYGDDFKLDSVEGLTRRERVKLMGNGVCPPVMEAIVKALITQK